MEEFINNDKKLGLKYDFNLVKKEFKKLKIPKDVYDPSKLPLEVAKWYISMSPRGVGKTTNILLLGMIMNKLYGTEIQYIRFHESMIMNKNIKDIFEVIIQFKYIEKLTNGKYDNVIYKARRWYYCKYQEDGTCDIAENHFMMCLSVDKNETYKSTYNAPKGDFILVDEFIEKYYLDSYFIDMVDLFKTIGRDRLSPIIFLSANTIDKFHPFFHELQISDYVEIMEMGDKKLVTTELGTNLYVEIINKFTLDKKSNDIKSEVNRLYYGFSNPKMSSITGNESWNVQVYPHPPKEFEIHRRNFYISYLDKLINLEICSSGRVMFLNCHLATKTYNDSIIFTNKKDVFDNRQFYGFGNGKFHRIIWTLIDQHKVTYQTNDVGAIVTNYINSIKMNK